MASCRFQSSSSRHRVTKFVGPTERLIAVSLHWFSAEFQCSFAISCLRYDALPNLGFMINGTSKAVPLAVILYENLVQMPFPVRVCAYPADPLSADFGGEHRTISILPISTRFMADVYGALMLQILDVSLQKWKLHHSLPNDFKASVYIIEWGTFVVS